MMIVKSGGAAAFLERQSILVRNRGRLPEISNVMVIGGPSSGLLGAMLRLMFGYDLNVRTVASLGIALDAVQKQAPDLMFLDHEIGTPGTPALQAIPIIRRCGFAGPIFVTAQSPSLAAVRALLEAGAADVIDRDELDSARIAEALLEACVPDSAAAE